jgi:hypothetical protein
MTPALTLPVFSCLSPAEIRDEFHSEQPTGTP